MIKIPYKQVAAVENNKRHAQMAVAAQYNWPRLHQVVIDEAKVLTLACYGPSLQDTYKDMKHPIMSMSGATKWLAERGIIADYHIDMDPRANKVNDVTPVIPGVKYVMATVCHPDVFKILKEANADVTLFHVYSTDTTWEWINSIEEDPETVEVRGHSTIGLTAFHIGGIMGYRHFEVHGMDGSFKDISRQERHAGPHTGHKQNKDGITWPAGGVVYATSQIMANAVAETINAMINYPIFCVFHGSGLTQALIRETQFPNGNACCVDEVEKAIQVRTRTSHMLDKLVLTPGLASVSSAAWKVLQGTVDPLWTNEMQEVRKRNSPRRKNAAYNTGSITVEQMVQLRSLCEYLKPKVIVEIGTFIGNSTMAMKADKIYTCDKSNNCFESSDTIKYYPQTGSTQMLQELVALGIKVDMFFFDGRIVPEDLVPIAHLTQHGKTVYVFDDYVGTEKGVVNARVIAAMLPTNLNGWMLIEPDPLLKGKSTLAAIAPLALFRS